MKKLTIILLFLITAPNGIKAQPTWQWVKKMDINPIPGSLPIWSLETDMTGFIYTGGQFSEPLNGPGTPQNQAVMFDTIAVTSYGYMDAFVAKMDAAGNFAWVRHGGGSVSPPPPSYYAYDFADRTRKISLSGDGHVLNVYGQYQTFAIFSGIQFPDYGIGGNFYGAYNNNGGLIRMRSFGTQTSGYFNMAAGESQNLYIVGGSSEYPVWFGPEADNDTISTGAFVLKADTAGNKTLLAHYPNSSYFISNVENREDRVVTAGRYINEISLNGQDTLFNDVWGYILSVLDTTGNILWYKDIRSDTGIVWIRNMDIATDHLNNVYVTGLFQDSLKIDTAAVVSPNMYVYDIYFAKFDASGNLEWLQQLNTEYPDTVGNSGFQLFYRRPLPSIDVGADGNIALAGTVFGNATFGSSSINTNGFEHAFVAMYGPDGNCLGFDHFGRAYASCVTIDKSTGDPIIGGVLTDSLSMSSDVPLQAFIARHDNITGIPSNKTDGTGSDKLFIYANPNKGAFNVRVPEELASLDNALLLVYDNTGREVARFQMEDFAAGKTPFFDIRHTASGQYTVKLIQDGKAYVGKIIVE